MNVPELRRNELTNKQMNEHTYGQTEKRKLYTRRHKCRGYKYRTSVKTRDPTEPPLKIQLLLSLFYYYYAF